MDTDRRTDAITITTIGRSRRIIAIETTCLQCHSTYWLPVQDKGTFRHTCEHMGGAAVINKYG
jgi:hypothetical protein